ncbi:BQ2448_2857 [Microbotryum intermedium]|uniref:BQ2448_2857 protein n=1 Tax=Microbotryum intermedium TaxID=269621 RepID=A0A238FEN7_9BASI|nr:BQ2448_2857 [Microbotryum intermedium]
MDADTVFGYVAASLIGLGGAIGYLKRGSVASLVSGGGSGALLLLGVYQQTKNRKQVGLMVAVSLLLVGVMGPKAVRSAKFMPSGLVTGSMQLLSVIMLVRFGPRLL